MKDFIYKIKKECEDIKVKYKIQQESPKQMPTPLLKEHLYEAIRNLIPCFGVTDEELRRFKQPAIRRVLKKDEYPDDDGKSAAYSPLENFFYFPIRDEWELGGCDASAYGIFGPATIHHEAGHYLHFAVNPNHIKGTKLFLEKGIDLKGYSELNEWVAEYGNIILRLRDHEELLFLYHDLINLYHEKGPEFLPVLARMSLEDTIKKGIIKI